MQVRIVAGGELEQQQHPQQASVECKEKPPLQPATEHPSGAAAAVAADTRVLAIGHHRGSNSAHGSQQPLSLPDLPSAASFRDWLARGKKAVGGKAGKKQQKQQQTDQHEDAFAALAAAPGTTSALFRAALQAVSALAAVRAADPQRLIEADASAQQRSLRREHNAVLYIV